MIGLTDTIYERVKLAAIGMVWLVWVSLLYLVFTQNSELPRWFGLTFFLGFIPYILFNVLFHRIDEKD